MKAPVAVCAAVLLLAIGVAMIIVGHKTASDPELIIGILMACSSAVPLGWLAHKSDSRTMDRLEAIALTVEQ